MKWGAIAAGLLVVVAALGIWLRAPLPPPTVTGSGAITNDGMQKLGMVTDGSRIYFGETTSTKYSIAQVSGAGGETGTLDLPIANPQLRDISKDQSELLVGQLVVTEVAVSDEGPYWAVPMPAGSPRRLGDAVGRDARCGHRTAT
jgi:hypothetical protein